MTFPDSLKSARLKSSLTQLEAADRLRISRRSLQSWEAGRLVPIFPAQVGSLQLLREAADRPAKPSNP